MPSGIDAERLVSRDLIAKDLLVGSRRHIGGAGDLIALPAKRTTNNWKSLLVEIKATKDPFSGLGPADRAAMRATAFQFNVEPVLAYVTCIKHEGRWRTEILYCHESDWPE